MHKNDILVLICSSSDRPLNHPQKLLSEQRGGPSHGRITTSKETGNAGGLGIE
jgi:hypothetical protein